MSKGWSPKVPKSTSILGKKSFLKQILVSIQTVKLQSNGLGLIICILKEPSDNFVPLMNTQNRKIITYDLQKLPNLGTGFVHHK